jgi:NAD(P)H dehydrogenase (quinone)
MKISVILAHPDRNSFNHAIALCAVERLKKNRHNVFFHDLYGEGFNPLLAGEEITEDAFLPGEINAYCEEIRAADGIVIVHPNWWGQPPAILKGWIDRVMRPGMAYEFVEGDSGEGIPKGLLQAKAAIVFNTSNTAPEREAGVFGDPLETIWRNCVFGLCGVNIFHRRTFRVVVTSTDTQRKEWLGEVKAMIDSIFTNQEYHMGVT